MQVTTTVKMKLYTDKAADAAFSEVCKAYASACDAVSKHVFDAEQYYRSAQTWHGQLYDAVRRDYGLKSQMACSVFRTVKSKYDAVRTQMKNMPYSFKCEGKKYTFRRTLDWLRRPISFHTPFCDLVRGRDWSFVTKDGERMLSINTLGKRIVVPYNRHFDEVLFAEGVTHGGARLLKRKGTWYLHISVTVDADEPVHKRICGYDRGLRFVVTTYDGEHTTFVNGCDIAKRRNKYHRTRKSLQAKNTRGARRTLRRISGRENRWMSDVNHCLSKTLTKEPHTLHVIEDLTDISLDSDNLTDNNYSRQLRSWSFYDLEQKMIYKAHLNHSEVISVPPAFTSQRCPKCGHIHKGNRQKKLHLFRCQSCGYTSNDDRVAAMNIYELGARYLKTGKLSGFSKQQA